MHAAVFVSSIPPIIGLRQRRNAKKTAEERFNMLARGWLAYPVTPMHRNYRRRAVVYVTPRPANNLYNRSSAVDSLLIQPTPGRQANLGLQLYNRPSSVAIRPSASTSKNAIRPSATIPKTRPSSSVCTNGAMRKTAEERFHTLARGWLAYPVTSIHSHLPPKSGCICHPPICHFGII